MNLEIESSTKLARRTWKEKLAEDVIEVFELLYVIVSESIEWKLSQIMAGLCLNDFWWGCTS